MGKHLVLVGGGHAHLTALKNLSEFTRRGHGVTLVSASSYHYYSGMGPGMLSGIYNPSEVRFHVKKMAEERGAEFIEDNVVKIDPVDRRLFCVPVGTSFTMWSPSIREARCPSRLSRTESGTTLLRSSP